MSIPDETGGARLRRFARRLVGSADAVARSDGDAEGAPAPPECPVRAQQERLLRAVPQLERIVAREIMTRRRDIVALPATATRAQTLALLAEEPPSRIPVYGADLDDIVGILLVKDLLVRMATEPAGDDGFDLARLMREPLFVPEAKRLGTLLAELRARGAHMAIVVDEFGGTAGLVTLEDVLEQIVGEIHDEYDVPHPDFESTHDGDVLMDGGVALADAARRLGVILPEKDYDTVGGFAFGELGRLPVPGDRVFLEGAGELVVEAVDERRITRIRYTPLAATGREVRTDASPGDRTPASVRRAPADLV